MINQRPSQSCPNLVAEAGLYHYATESDGNSSEAPINENNHALDALRYLISRLDARRMARFRKSPTAAETPTDASPSPAPAPLRRANKWLTIHNEALWTRLF